MADEEQPFTGQVEDFYENGQKKWESNYKDGKLHGLQTEWHKNGQMKAKGVCKDGEREGDWKFWYEDGQVERDITYKDGYIHDVDGEAPEPRCYQDDYGYDDFEWQDPPNP